MNVPRLHGRIWASFSFSAPSAPRGSAAGDRVERFLVDEVTTVRGVSLPEVARGWTVTRVERQSHGPAPGGALVLAGTTQHLLYTSGEQQAELQRISTKGPGAVSVLI